MKKLFCGILAVVLILGCLAGCTNKKQVDPKLCFLHNPNLSFTDSKEQIVKTENLECYDEDLNMYTPKGDTSYVTINGLNFFVSYFFNEDDLFREINYGFFPRDSEEYDDYQENTSFYFDKMKDYLFSIYGAGKDYEDSVLDYQGYTWDVSDGKDNSYQILLAQSKKYSSLQLSVTATGAGRTQVEKNLDQTNSQLSESWENVAEAAKEFQEGIESSPGVSFYSIVPQNGTITQEQFDSLKEGMTYSEAMKILGSPEDPNIPEDGSSFTCEWGWDSNSAFVLLSFNDGKLGYMSSYGLD